MKLTVKANKIWYNGRAIGPASALLTDPSELKWLGAAQGVHHKLLPARADYIFSVGERVFVGESKRASDLKSSHASRRLQRQLAADIDMGDGVCLFLRGGLRLDDSWGELIDPEDRRDLLWQDLACMQTRGVYVLPLPKEDALVPRWIGAYRKALSTNGIRALTGFDRPKPDRKAGYILRRVPGIGPARSAELIAYYGVAGEVAAAVKDKDTFKERWGDSLTTKLYTAYWEEE